MITIKKTIHHSSIEVDIMHGLIYYYRVVAISSDSVFYIGFQSIHHPLLLQEFKHLLEYS